MPKLQELLMPYNPWFEKGIDGLADIPTFTRPVFKALVADIQTIPQMISIIGPRRIGKTTLLKQIIRYFLKEGVPQKNLIYYSLDDPALFLPNTEAGKVMEALMRDAHSLASQSGKPVYLFLDEIQRFDRWELHLKKYYDLKYPVKIIISGSASTPIFKKSRESLLGRVKDYHLLPFSFREYSLYNVKDDPVLVAEAEKIHEVGEKLIGMLLGDPRHFDTKKISLGNVSDALWGKTEELFVKYLKESGFPEVWNLPNWEQKIDYLYDNQVKKVLFEDLVLAVDLRKPEPLKRFYVSLLEHPGREANLSKISRDLGIQSAAIEKYLPLLEMTDMVYDIPKFRKSAIGIRRGNVKFYLVDLALRNAVLRQQDVSMEDETLLGFYAENLVANALKKLEGILALDYYRESRGIEIDFIVHVGPRKYLPVEVKYQKTIDSKMPRSIQAFQKKYGGQTAMIITKNRDDFMVKDRILYIPLLYFLLMLD